MKKADNQKSCDPTKCKEKALIKAKNHFLTKKSRRGSERAPTASDLTQGA